MSIWLYVFVSLLGVIICHYLSELYLRKDKVILFIIYFLVFVEFGSQHYSLTFDKTFVRNWLFLFEADNSAYTDWYSFIGLVFVIVTVCTLPPSRLTFLNRFLNKGRR
ncbi:hypothetical protein [Vibrio neptunius]|uniref:Uncharacterized protein n=1 Tax=Vibrio neptunius TaxID=170651 RepID=A0ABS3A1Y5_9VIBR|nr:hypothetical protein [Vibrio neptunius]MBN3492906.1 hypothetical protein [Vibrio neptunius]MBN3515376.1 hypothetical protein [Vibrio neptunius]MBN3549438.1 hypothetical protein [Vibrio neptunius]MBN3577707.1 hypothetical protein [Vibrio neptunius]MCH9871371.1 hypothetical protein [Vibrio neptunius]